ncbi:MAG: hypothetical protein WC632_06905 [Candidatus Margulisiibacteriota bacterium]
MAKLNDSKINDLIKQYATELIGTSHIRIPSYGIKPEPVEDKAAYRHKELENESFAQDIHLKRITLIILFCFLAIETIVVFVFTGLQATKLFILEEWSFKLLLISTIVQITIMLNVAVKHLFPNK